MQNKQRSPFRVLSIDPGVERVGIAVIEKAGSKETLLFSECFKTSPKMSHEKRLKCIGEKIRETILKYSPSHAAIEQLFFSNNQKTALKVAEARGVILYEAAAHNVAVFEYNPLQIKMAVTGYGKSSKQQIISMVQKLIDIPQKKVIDDEFDAIAIGLTHTATHRLNT